MSVERTFLPGMRYFPISKAPDMHWLLQRSRVKEGDPIVLIMLHNCSIMCHVFYAICVWLKQMIIILCTSFKSIIKNGRIFK
jgi:hypothetical protein